MLSSVFYNVNTPLPKIFDSTISESQIVTTVELIFQFCLHAVYLLALDLQILYTF